MVKDLNSVLVISDQYPSAKHGTALTYRTLMSSKLFSKRWHFYTILSDFDYSRIPMGGDKQKHSKSSAVIRLLKSNKLFFDLANAMRLLISLALHAKQIRLIAPDYIYIPISSLNSIAAFIAIRVILRNSKRIAHFYDDPFRYLKRGSTIYRNIYRSGIAFVCRRSEFLFAISEQMSEEIQQFTGRTPKIFSASIPENVQKFRNIEWNRERIIVNITGTLSTKWLADYITLAKETVLLMPKGVPKPIFNYIGSEENAKIIRAALDGCELLDFTNCSEESFRRTDKIQNQCFLLVSGFSNHAIQSTRTSFFTKIPYICQFGIPVIVYCPKEVYISRSAIEHKWGVHADSHIEFVNIIKHLYKHGDTLNLGEAAHRFSIQYIDSAVRKRMREALTEDSNNK